MVKLFMKLLRMDMYQSVGLICLCGPSMRPLKASDPVLCISMKPCRGDLPSYTTPGSGVELLWRPQGGPLLLPWSSPTSHWEDWSFVTMYFFSRELATTLCQVHLGSRHIFSPGPVHSLPGIGREILRLIFFLSYFFFFTQHLVWC